MFNLSNLLSLARGPLALLFLQESVQLRLLAILLAGISDILDGYLARRYGCTSQFGAFLDPSMDKVFVLTALCVFVGEGRLGTDQAIAMLCRDFSILIFLGYLSVTGNWARYYLRALWCGKATTILQFLVLTCLTCRIMVPPQIYPLFMLLGALALVELVVLNRHSVA